MVCETHTIAFVLHEKLLEGDGSVSTLDGRHQ